MTRGYAARSVFVESGNPDGLAVVLEGMETPNLFVETSAPPPPYEVRWFSSIGSVVIRETVSSVFVGDLLLGEFDALDRDRGPRNVLAVTIAKSGVHLGRLAAAFGIGEEYLRRLRRKEEAHGIAAVLLRRQGKVTKVTAARRAAWHAQFEAGVKPINVFREQPRRGRLSFTTVWRVFEQWRHATRPTRPTVEPLVIAAAGQLTLWSTAKTSASEPEPADEHATAEEDGRAITPMVAQPVRSGQLVQHVGTWLMLALAKQLGLYEEAQHAFGGRGGDGLRIALDAVVCALAIQQRCVEGVRRLATPTGPTLLRSARVPTASGVRKLFGRLVTQMGSPATLDARIAARFIAAAQADNGPAVFYVDNHLRPYTGKHVVRKGWRMQARRVLPGTTDYYVHDEEGRPVFRVPVPSHDSLVAHLLPIAQRLREALGDGERILLAFDRAGAHAEQLAVLRDAGFEWVTYERKPYPELPTTAFSPTTIEGEALGLHESRLRNLGAGRGRVRRVAIRTADDRQVNLLSWSQESAERVVAIMGKRWRQENGFKHGVERWGINQLDGRSVEPYPPHTIIPNPARRRLDRALRVARVAEGDARRNLARLPVGSDRRARAEQDLAEAIERQAQLEAVRPWLPKHAPVSQTELADTLVHHDVAYKTVVDVIRIVCANAESDLAGMLAPLLTKPREAKKVVANLLAAPGKVAVTRHAIHLRLAPAANVAERRAIQQLFAAINQRKLTLPGDRHGLPLRLELQL
jgi:hypothetical protein